MYPDNVHPVHKLIIDQSNISIDEFRKMTPVKHRMEFLDVRMTLLDDTDDAETSNNPQIINKL